MKLGKKILVASALLTLFANGFADEVFNITVNGNINTASTSQPSANPSQAHPITFSNGGATTKVTIPTGAGQVVPLSLTIDGYNGFVITPNGQTSVEVSPSAVELPLASIVSAKIAANGEIDVTVNEPSSNLGFYNATVNLAPGEVVDFAGSTITGGAGGNSGAKFSGLSGSQAISLTDSAHNINFVGKFYVNAGPNTSYTVPYIPGSSIVITHGGANNNGNLSAGVAHYSLNFGSFSSENN